VSEVYKEVDTVSPPGSQALLLCPQIPAGQSQLLVRGVNSLTVGASSA